MRLAWKRTTSLVAKNGGFCSSNLKRIHLRKQQTSRGFGSLWKTVSSNHAAHLSALQVAKCAEEEEQEQPMFGEKHVG